MKIHTLTSLGEISRSLRQDGKTIVHCHGCFDFLHIGHVRHLQQAALYGDVLFVTVTADEFVGKGSGRPLFNATDRTHMLEALRFVNGVAISDSPNAFNAITIIAPHYYVKGIDYADRGVADIERGAARSVGAKLVFTTSEKHSTTELLNRLKS